MPKGELPILCDPLAPLGDDDPKDDDPPEAPLGDDDPKEVPPDAPLVADDPKGGGFPPPVAPLGDDPKDVPLDPKGGGFSLFCCSCCCCDMPKAGLEFPKDGVPPAFPNEGVPPALPKDGVPPALPKEGAPPLDGLQLLLLLPFVVVAEEKDDESFLESRFEVQVLPLNDEELLPGKNSDHRFFICSRHGTNVCSQIHNKSMAPPTVLGYSNATQCFPRPSMIIPSPQLKLSGNYNSGSGDFGREK